VVIRSIHQVGWDFVLPAMMASLSLLAAGGGVWILLYRMSSMKMEAMALWSFWAFILYSGMVVMRMLGLTYHAHAGDLGWFRRRPKWATSARHGRIYANS
jgi:hypothetical protein